MALSNRDRVGKGLEKLREGLRPFVEREYEAKYGEEWVHEALEVLKRDWRHGREGRLDTQALLQLMQRRWGEIFDRILGRAERALVNELIDVRNKWAHEESFSTDDAERALDSMRRLLEAVSAPEAQEVGRMRMELLRQRFEEEQKRLAQRRAREATAGRPESGLRPWREIVEPHDDVASGDYREAEFAADLEQVHRGQATAAEYADPREFFARTYLTQGLRNLLSTALRRLGEGASGEGEPIVELQTNFGGGKTHSMLALYHLFSGADAHELPGVDTLLAETGVRRVPRANRAVLVGTALSPGQPSRKPDGTEVRTLWGELAWQLEAAGDARAAYALVADSDARRTSPGSDVLKALLARHAPCLILIDEWVAYARQLYNRDDLPAGSFDSQFTFAQSLCEAVAATPGALLVVSIPSSDIEVGGEAGREALERLRNVVQRKAASWQPASAEESFEIVRRRLFKPLTDPDLMRERDAVVAAFRQMYQNNAQIFPAETRGADYGERLRRAYPIHPELFERLYNDWSTLDRFQRTRGVLRLMAAVIHELWIREDRNLLIMPGMLPLDAPRVADELTRYLEPPWRPILDQDVDGENALPLRLDRGNPAFGKVSATRRVARAIFMGSAPVHQRPNKGLDDLHVRLACVQPGEQPAVFGDALRRLTDEAGHLYVDAGRYWYSLQQNINRLARERAAQYREDEVHAVICERLRRMSRRSEPFAGVHACPDGPGDVADEDTVRLVILPPDRWHRQGEPASPAVEAAKEIFETRSGGPRMHRNMLVFMALDGRQREGVEKAVREWLAWKGIREEEEALNLDAYQRRLAQTKAEQADETVGRRIQEGWCWLLYPEQPDPKGPIAWQAQRASSQTPIPARAARKLEQLGAFATRFGAASLQMWMDRCGLWRGSERVRISQLWEDFARYVYLPRLRDMAVLLGAVAEGVGRIDWTDSFAYAEGWDETRGEPAGLKAATQISPSVAGWIIHPDLARRFLDEKRGERVPPGEGDKGKPGVTEPHVGSPGSPEATALRRFHGSVTIDPARLVSRISTISEEVVQHLLSALEVRIRLEIEARFPDGVPDDLRRVISENCGQLGFDHASFEEE